MIPAAGSQSPTFPTLGHSQEAMPALPVEKVIPEILIRKHHNCAAALVEDNPVLSARTVKLVFHHKNKLLVDLTQLSLDQLIAPDQHYLDHCRLDLLEDARQRYFRHSKRQEASKLLKQDRDPSLLAFAAACNNVNTLWATLAGLGQSFKDKLDDETRRALLDKHRLCPMKTFHDPRYCESEDVTSLRKFPEEIADQLLAQQTISVPSMPDWLCGAPPKKGHVIKKTLIEKLHAAGFDQTDPVIFVGSVPPVIANPFAAKQLFVEDSGSLGTHHGKFSHLAAVLALAESGKLTPALLHKILANEGLWETWLDTIIWATLPQIEVVSEESGRREKIVFHGAAERLTCQSPENIHLMFLEKRLSEAASNIRNQPDNTRKQAFLRAFGIGDQSSVCIDEKLGELYEDLALLEACIIDSMYKGLYQNAGVHQFRPDEKVSYNSFALSSTELSSRAKSYLSAGHTVTGAGFCGERYTKTSLKTEEGIDAFVRNHSRRHSDFSFIVQKKMVQEKAAHKRTLGHASASEISSAAKKIRLSSPQSGLE